MILFQWVWRSTSLITPLKEIKQLLSGTGILETAQPAVNRIPHILICSQVTIQLLCQSVMLITYRARQLLIELQYSLRFPLMNVLIPKKSGFSVMTLKRTGWTNITIFTRPGDASRDICGVSWTRVECLPTMGITLVILQDQATIHG